MLDLRRLSGKFFLRHWTSAWILGALLTATAHAGWMVLPPHDTRTPLPSELPENAESIEPGDRWEHSDKYRWLIGELTIPETIDDKPTKGKAVGMKFSCADGGEVHVNGVFQSRFDNDHPALVLLTENAQPGAKVRLQALVYRKVQGGDHFNEATWAIIEPKRSTQTLKLKVHASKPKGPVPDGLVGLSQGGGLADYEDATAAKLREGGFKWFRMDNILTNVLKAKEDGSTYYDWTDFDRRVDFMYKMGADPILAVSYMPIPLDAVVNHDRQSAPKDYGTWEEICYRAAKRSIDRGVRVPFWEVWNEVNTGWLKPGPQDKGTERFHKMYNEALGKLQPEMEVIRRFEAYCKLYKATVEGVRRADPKAMFGGPALASGPFENDERGHCFHGRGFTRGLMAYCTEENLPLDFLSWHEYFQPWFVIDEEAKAFYAYMEDYPEIKPQVKSLMITEWNQAWWGDRPHDHEIGASWCADSLVRACLPNKVDRPCFFYVKQNDDNFRGDFSMLMRNNVPKASYNAMKIFNHLSGDWIEFEGTDDDVCGVAAWDRKKPRLAVVIVNYRDRYGLPRKVSLEIPSLPEEVRNGEWREWLVDGTHSNVWHDREKAELEMVNEGNVRGGKLTLNRTLLPNSITLIEIIPADKK